MWLCTVQSGRTVLTSVWPRLQVMSHSMCNPQRMRNALPPRAQPSVFATQSKHLAAGCAFYIYIFKFVMLPFVSFLFLSPPSSWGHDMSDSPSPRCDLFIDILNQLNPSGKGQRSRSLMGTGSWRHYHQTDVPCRGGRVPRCYTKMR